MKLVEIVGGRPQFIKLSVVSREIERRGHTSIIVHTGQHFDFNMSQAFFEELEIPEPKYNLGVSGGSHGEMTGRMLQKIEKVLMQESPDMVVVFGDMNSTLAGALAAAKLGIPICHVEAGGRTHCRTNPEEINRVCTDHISDLLMTASEKDMDELRRENLAERAYFVGNTMFDAFLRNSEKRNIKEIEIVDLSGHRVVVPNDYYYMTCHRQENTYNDENLTGILDAMEQLESPVIYPVHPRNKERVTRLIDKYEYKNVFFTEPIGYLESICLIKNCKAVVTDSGGVQTEAFFAKKKCVTVLDFVVWPELMRDGLNELAKPNPKDIIEKLRLPMKIDLSYKPFGDGNAAKKIVDEIEKYGG